MPNASLSGCALAPPCAALHVGTWCMGNTAPVTGRARAVEGAQTFAFACVALQADAALKTTRATLAGKEEKLRAMGKQV